ncbi:bifunctional riboflavin kinase/FAD synthetase [uncultured Umboniibacter sp.]|uniref:bifunctional riboflavin kinase/FAD synthetase n=1 Tax=uncultured Umboniibacter sp. TaxID=1798917 RepID=UPI00262E29B3|nr:bifunctional riboflavin kinase/FAD synthetase [uncultured Umboniibacter sp.]
MQLIRGLHNLVQISSASVVTIGAFDGLHLGHQAILNRVKQLAEAANAVPTVVLFEPQPSEYFAPDQAPARLSRFRDKVELLMSYGIQRIVCLRFNQQMQNMTPAYFVSKVLVDGLKTQHLIVGDDFRFGANREGDFELLQQLAPESGFIVEDTPTTEVDGERVSSTRIRERLLSGECAQAKLLLSRDFTIQGHVGKGRQLGRTIGVPTANVALRRRRSPLHGVFAVRVQVGEKWHNGVANIGVKPTVGAEPIPSLEAHIFDFDQDIYGQAIKVAFLTKLRDEQTFSSFAELQQQIARDQQAARDYFVNEFKVIE